MSTESNKMNIMRSLLSLFILATSLLACGQGKTSNSDNNKYIKKTDAEWKKELTAEQYEVLRNKGTERAFTGEL